MSRIHEALKKAAEERSSRLATDGSPNFADVAGDVTRSSLAEQQLTRPQLHTELRKPAGPGRLQFEELVKRCAHPKWKIDPRSSVFHGADDHESVPSASALCVRVSTKSLAFSHSKKF